ncbi:MAG TPA: penicillin-binding transpeptidase domain-containing protein [Polyangiaceae bacterium]
MRSSLRLVPLLLGALGCASAAPAVPAAQSPAPVAAGVGPAPSAPVPVVVTDATRLTELPIEERADFVEAFEREQVSGTIAIFDSTTKTLSCSDVERCRRVHPPASTFKIANSIIALETGVVDDAGTILPWDGKQYPVQDWNQDLALRDAIRVSCVPCFQSIARKVGEARMREWVTKLDYGNRDIAGGIDQFWLRGALRISPVQELDFVRRLDLAQLPVRELVRETVIDMITLDVGPEHVLRGKTGFQPGPPETELVGWFVGWIERGSQHVYFATALDGHQKDVDFMKARRRVTEHVLEKLGLLP